VRTFDQPQVFLFDEILRQRLIPIEEMHTPLMRGHLPAFNDVPIYRVNLSLPLRGNLFDNVVMVKHEGHCTTRALNVFADWHPCHWMHRL
jgi:hypothetical protein